MMTWYLLHEAGKRHGGKGTLKDRKTLSDDAHQSGLTSVVYNKELWLYKLKYGSRENLYGMGGDYHELHGSIVPAQYHTDLVHSLSMLSQDRLASMCQ